MRIIYIEGQCSKNENCRQNRARFTFTDARYTRFTPLMLFHLDRNNHLLYLKEVLAARYASLDRDSTLDQSVRMRMDSRYLALG